MVGARHDFIEVSEAEILLGEPEVLRQLLPGRLLDDSRARESDQRARLGDRDVAERRERGEDAHNQAAAVWILFDLLNHPVDLVDRSSVRSPPVAPLRTVNPPKITFGIGPFIPDRDSMLVQVFDICFAPQKPEQFVNDRLQVKFLGGQSRKTLRSGKRACAPKTE